MSRKHGHAKKRRRKRASPVACPSCHGPGDGSPGSVLRALAFLLETAAAAGMKIRVRHDVIIGEGRKAGGYVLRDHGDRWRVINLPCDPGRAPPGPDDDDD